MSIFRCPRCKNKAVYLEEQKAFFCEHCDKYIWTIVDCPECQITIRVATRVRPHTVTCPGCGMCITLGIDDTIKAIPAGSSRASRTHQPLLCSHCSNPVESDWWFCPVCACRLWMDDTMGSLGKCTGCGFPVEAQWHHCVFCSKELRKGSQGGGSPAPSWRENGPRSLKGPEKKGEELPARSSNDNPHEPEGPGRGEPLSVSFDELVDGTDGDMEELPELDEEFFCPECDQPVSVQATRCPNCSVEFQGDENEDDELDELFGEEEPDDTGDPGEPEVVEDLDPDELEDYVERSYCPHCRKVVEEEWLVCRFCTKELRKEEDISTSCPSCGKEIKGLRMICPHCSSDLRNQPRHDNNTVHENETSDD